MYPLLFVDAGMSGGQISVLFGLWSLVGFVLEVPSGALADRIPRRHLLIAAQVVRAAGFASWLVWPTFAGFALGFALWGASGAASSGTWQAMLYEELDARGAADRYARIVGRAEALAAVGALAGTALATPLIALGGGYAAAGWTSVAVCLVAAVVASRLPRSVPTDAETEPNYFSTLRAGVTEAVRNRAVGRIVLVVVVLSGVTAIEEYFPLLAGDHHLSPAVLPLLLLAPAAGYAIGAEVGGRFGALSPRWLAVVATVGAVAFAAGALLRHPVGFLGIAVGFGLLACAIVVAGARLQETLTGPRATVTSVSAVGEEAVAIGVFAVFGVASGLVPLFVLTAVAVLPVLALPIARWLPPAAREK
ncbi:MFS transporter [Cryptosporangium aurantiacum]|uniref:Predicted arabinose efflux permease, MFS family n=1 Tax=Cryptosporangium aurantiacum TaxID=134849 RepID=A0A1M7K098_9ACTN|nr:MFS transporter [Cryptosporangium aurantiacum]SHM58740.1 Predicted arabinose efflux permease, MFS family [Cryptosporangium aurantiacum]